MIVAPTQPYSIDVTIVNCVFAYVVVATRGFNIYTVIVVWDGIAWDVVVAGGVKVYAIIIVVWDGVIYDIIATGIIEINGVIVIMGGVTYYDVVFTGVKNIYTRSFIVWNSVACDIIAIGRTKTYASIVIQNNVAKNSDMAWVNNNSSFVPSLSTFLHSCHIHR